MPAAVAGLVVNVALLLALVPRGGLGLGIAGAGIALCGAYVAMVAVMHLLTRNVFAVRFQWGRLAQLAAIFAVVGVSGELLLPTSGASGLVLRAVWLAFVPALLILTHFFAPHEREQARALVVDARRRVAAFRAGRRRRGGIRRGPPQRHLIQRIYGSEKRSAVWLSAAISPCSLAICETSGPVDPAYLPAYESSDGSRTGLTTSCAMREPG